MFEDVFFSLDLRHPSFSIADLMAVLTWSIGNPPILSCVILFLAVALPTEFLSDESGWAGVGVRASVSTDYGGGWLPSCGVGGAFS
jgi:hypothetical protein